MILFDLRCAKDHVFEAWFRDGDTAERQLAARKVACPDCGSAKVVKAPMAPRIGKGATSAGRAPSEKAPGDPGDKSPGAPAQGAVAGPAAVMARELRALRAKIEANFDHVGERFAEEARKIHYGETEARGIYGETSDEDARSLREEGVEFARIPWLPRHDS
jgi:hypothetical protein